MPRKYLILAKTEPGGHFVPADYLSDTKMAALDDIEHCHKNGLNGEAS